jgi:hypothetical protein
VIPLIMKPARNVLGRAHQKVQKKGRKWQRRKRGLELPPKLLSAVFLKSKKREILQFHGINKVNLFTFLLAKVKK